MQLARPARLYIIGISCLSLALVLRVLGSYPVQGSAGFWLLVLAMTALATVGDRYPVLVAPGMYLQVSTIPLFASLLIFNPAVTIIIAGTSSLASQLWRRSPRVELVFNLAQTLVYVSAASLVLQAFSPTPWPPGRWQGWLGVVLAAAVMYMVNSALVAGIVSLARGINFFRVWVSSQSQLTLTANAVMSALGLLAALVVVPYPWSILLMALPAGAVLMALDRTVRVQAQHQKLAEQNSQLAASLKVQAEQLRVEIAERRLVAQQQNALAAGLRGVVAAADELIACPDVDSLARRASELAPDLNCLADLPPNESQEVQRKVQVVYSSLVHNILERKHAEEEIRRQNQELAALNQVGQALSRLAEPNEILSLIDAMIGQVSDNRNLYIALYDFASREISFPVYSIKGQRVRVPSRPFGQGITEYVLQTREPLLIVERMQETMAGLGIELIGRPCESLLAVPMLVGENALGVIAIQDYQNPGAFTQADVALLTTVAAQAAIAIENSRLYQAEREQRALAETLREIGALLVSALDEDVVLDRILAQVDRVLPSDTATVSLIEGDTVRFVRNRGYERFNMQNLDEVSLSIADTLDLRQMIETGEPSVIADTTADPGWVGLPGFEWLRSFASAPIRVRGVVIGFLSVESATPGFFGPVHGERLRVFADQAAIALENARLVQAERRQFRRLQESQAQLVQVEKMAAMGRLIASITHEINNPLQAVEGALSLAGEELQSNFRRDKLQRYLSMAEQEVERIANIMRRVRDFYRPARQERQPTDVHTVLENVLELTGRQLEHSNIAVERAWEPDLPLVQANPDHLKQVFLNLVLNAIDAMSRQAGTLRVRTVAEQMQSRSGDGPVPAVRIEFSDTGEGIPPDVMLRLFEPFTTSKKNGTGLGLSISYGIVQAHDGEITARSQPGMGTTFTILLPARRA